MGLAYGACGPTLLRSPGDPLAAQWRLWRVPLVARVTIERNHPSTPRLRVIATSRPHEVSFSEPKPAIRLENTMSNTRPMIRLAAVALALVDRKSTRLNSSHGYISYAVFCLKKKKNNIIIPAPLI